MPKVNVCVVVWTEPEASISESHCAEQAGLSSQLQSVMDAGELPVPLEVADEYDDVEELRDDDSVVLY